MTVARSSQCVFCTFTRSFRVPKSSRRKLHTSPVVRQNANKSSGPKVDIAKQGKNFKKVEKQEWSKHYSPEQIAAIEEASKIIKPESFEDGKGSMRADPWSINYFDDFTKIDPVADKPVRAPWQNLDPKQRLKTTEELTEDLYNLKESLPDTTEPPKDFFKDFDKNLRLTVGKEEAERNPRSATAPVIPRMESETGLKKKSGKQGQKTSTDTEATPALVRLLQMTGLNKQEFLNLNVKTIISHTVVNQTRMGKIRKQYVLSIAGNGKGLIGIGEGKSLEPTDARLQSQYRAIRNMQPIMRYEGRTIFGDVKGKVSATELELYARPPGFGLRCQQYIWEICKAAGISDLAARVTRSRNPMNTVKATIQALMSQKDPEEIAKGRGKKLVDVRRVYYAGQI